MIKRAIKLSIAAALLLWTAVNPGCNVMNATGYCWDEMRYIPDDEKIALESARYRASLKRGESNFPKRILFPHGDRVGVTVDFKDGDDFIDKRRCFIINVIGGPEAESQHVNLRTTRGPNDAEGRAFTLPSFLDKLNGKTFPFSRFIRTQYIDAHGKSLDVTVATQHYLTNCADSVRND